MSAPAWMPLYVADYLADTGHLSAAESGAYLHLIMHYWQKGGLPEDDRLLARLARMTADEWSEARQVLAPLFGPKWTHKRIDLELAKAARIRAKRSVAGKASAEARLNMGSTHVEQEGQQMSVGDGEGNNLDTTPTVQEEASTREADADIPLALEAFNDVADKAGWPKARMNDRRRKAFRRMLAEHGLEGWRNGLAKARGSPFLCGENDREWRADLDFLLRPQAFTKVLEGSYERSGQSGNGRRTGNAISESFARAVARRSGQGERQADADGGFRDDAGGTGGSQGPGRTIEGEVVAFPERH